MAQTTELHVLPMRLPAAIGQRSHTILRIQFFAACFVTVIFHIFSKAYIRSHSKKETGLAASWQGQRERLDDYDSVSAGNDDDDNDDDDDGDDDQMNMMVTLPHICMTFRIDDISAFI